MGQFPPPCPPHGNVESHPLPLRHACPILRDAWNGLRFLHETVQAFHYDIKPANVFCDVVRGVGGGRSRTFHGVIGDVDSDLWGFCLATWHP